MVSAPIRTASELRALLDELGVVAVSSLEDALSYATAATDQPDTLDAFALFIGSARADSTVRDVVGDWLNWDDVLESGGLSADFFTDAVPLSSEVGLDADAFDALAREATGAADVALTLTSESEAFTAVAYFGAREIAAAVLEQPSGRLESVLKQHDIASARLADAIRNLGPSPPSDNEATVDAVASRDEALTLTGHSRGVSGVAITPDGRLAVTTSADHTARVWDLVSGEPVSVFEGHTDAVNGVAITPDGRLAVTTSTDHTARVWDLVSGEPVSVFEGHDGVVIWVAITPDGRLAVTISADHTARVWDLVSGEPVSVFEGHTDAVNGVAITPDGRLAVTTSADHTARVWDLVSGEPVSVFEGHDGVVIWVAITPDGRLAVTTSADHTARVWDLVSGEPVSVFEGHTDIVNLVAITPDGRLAVTTSADHTARVWDLVSGEPVSVFEGHDGVVIWVAITPDGRLAVTTSADHTARVWDLVSGEPVSVFEGHTDIVNLVAITPDGRLAVTTSADHTARVWDVETDRVTSSPDLAQPTPKVVRDYWTVADTLGYSAYSQAVAAFIQHEETKPPLTIGVKGPWGAGKSSLMRMTQQRLDPPCDPRASEWTFPSIKFSDSISGQLELKDPASTDGGPDEEEPAPPMRIGNTVLPWRKPKGSAQGVTLGRMWRRSKKAPASIPDLSDLPTVEPSKPPSDSSIPRPPPPNPEDWRPTVWFNPWMYQTGEEVWAGLVQEILNQVTDRLPRGEREAFWFELNLRRVDRHELRRRIYKMAIDQILPAIISAVVALIVVFVGSQGEGWFVTGLGTFGFLGSLAWATRKLVGISGESASESIPEMVRGPFAAAGADMKKEMSSFSETIRDPEYEVRAGFLYLLHNDVHHVLDLVSTPKRPLVVFVDDLDRCSPGVVAQTIEAINLFLAGQFPNCIFVLALEPAVVAAHVESQNTELVKRLEQSDLGSDWTALGWRFLEKIVQLPLTLPRPSQIQSEEFLDSLLREVGQGQQDADPEAFPERREPDPAAKRQQRVDEKSASFEATNIREASQERSRLVDELVDEGEDEQEAERIATAVAVASVAKIWSDADATVRRVVKDYALDLPARNPRQIKRFLNLYRFYNFVAAPKWLAVTSAEDQEQVFRQVARLAALAIRWPFFLNLFALRVDDLTWVPVPPDGNVKDGPDAERLGRREGSATVLQAMESAALAGRDAWNAKLIEFKLAADPDAAPDKTAVAGEAWSQHFEDLYQFLKDSKQPPIGDFAQDFV